MRWVTGHGRRPISDRRVRTPYDTVASRNFTMARQYTFPSSRRQPTEASVRLPSIFAIEGLYGVWTTPPSPRLRGPRRVGPSHHGGRRCLTVKKPSGRLRPGSHPNQQPEAEQVLSPASSRVLSPRRSTSRRRKTCRSCGPAKVGAVLEESNGHGRLLLGQAPAGWSGRGNTLGGILNRGARKWRKVSADQVVNRPYDKAARWPNVAPIRAAVCWISSSSSRTASPL
jgi:hypothetical protein